MKRAVWSLVLAAGLLASLAAFVFASHALATNDATRHWRERPAVSLSDFGKVDRLEFTVLAGPKADRSKSYIGEPGLSLRLDIDGTVWLYDLGLGARDAQDTVRRNARLAGVDLSETGAVFLSHRHRDHMGGVAAEKSGRLDLAGIGRDDLRIITPPGALDMPKHSIMEIEQPAVLGKGVASLGPIRRALFIGPVDEQAMILDVRNYGLVAVVGCGHQTVPKLTERVDEVFGRPIRAVIGDLHYPVPEGRLRVAGIDAQRWLASGGGPLSPVGQTDVEVFKTWASESGTDLFLVGHDTHDAVLALPTVTPLAVGQVLNLPESD